MKKHYIILFIIIVLLIIAIIISLILLRNINNSEMSEEENYLMEYVEDESFVTVEPENSITMYNVLNTIINSSDSNYSFIREIYKINMPTVQAYAVFSRQNNNDRYSIIYLDAENSTYKIEEINADDYKNIVNNTISNKYIQNNSIPLENNNTYTISPISNDEIATIYYNIIRNLLTRNQSELYNILNEEYKSIRFQDNADFTAYCTNIIQSMPNAYLTQYSVTTNNGVEQYTCVDNYNNTYLIRLNTNCDIEVWLDDYTIETEDFKTKYESASIESKAITNADKVMKMINSKDYRAIYNLLDETYKANNFATLDSFTQYISTAFYNFNYYTISNISEQGPYYVITVTCKEKASASANTKENRMIISIGEGTSFTMSFALE